MPKFVLSLIWKLEPSFIPVYGTFVSMLFGRDICKVTSCASPSNIHVYMHDKKNQLFEALNQWRKFDVKAQLLLSKKSFICLNGSPLTMKNALYFILKAPFVLHIFKFSY